jgi:hypothetical protein
VFEKASGPDVVGKEQLDLLPQTAVNAARFLKKRTAGLGRVFQRAVEEFFYARPVQWAHSGPILLQAFFAQMKALIYCMHCTALVVDG